MQITNEFFGYRRQKQCYCLPQDCLRMDLLWDGTQVQLGVRELMERK